MSSGRLTVLAAWQKSLFIRRDATLHPSSFDDSKDVFALEKGICLGALCKIPTGAVILLSINGITDLVIDLAFIRFHIEPSRIHSLEDAAMTICFFRAIPNEESLFFHLPCSLFRETIFLGDLLGGHVGWNKDLLSADLWN